MRRVIEAFDLDMDEDWGSHYFHPDGAEIIPLRADLEGTVYRGPDAPRQFLSGMRESWETLRFQVTEIRRVGDRILAVVRVNVRSREAAMDFELTAAAVVRLRDGLITHLHTYRDPAEAEAATADVADAG